MGDQRIAAIEALFTLEDIGEGRVAMRLPSVGCGGWTLAGEPVKLRAAAEELRRAIAEVIVTTVGGAGQAETIVTLALMRDERDVLLRERSVLERRATAAEAETAALRAELERLRAPAEEKQLVIPGCDVPVADTRAAQNITEQKLRRCSRCGLTGHNVRRCEMT